MKKMVAAVVVLLGMAVSAVPAAEGIGLGFIAGSPTGLSAKLPLGGVNSINLLAGWNFYGRGRRGDAFYFNGDYVWNDFSLLQVNQGRLAVYYGPGANAAVAGGFFGIGVRGIFGILYQFSNAPLEVLFEVGPGINVLPDTDFGFSAGLGMRFLF